MISRNPKYEPPKPSQAKLASRLIWIVAIPTPVLMILITLPAFLKRESSGAGRLDVIQEQYFLIGSGIVLLTAAYVSNAMAKRRFENWPTIGVSLLAMVPALLGKYFQVEWSRLLMVVGSTILIWFAVVVPAQYRSIVKQIEQTEAVREPNGH